MSENRFQREAVRKLGAALGLKLHPEGQVFGASGHTSQDAVPGIYVAVAHTNSALDRALDRASRDAGSNHVALLMHRSPQGPWLVTVALDDLVAAAHHVTNLQQTAIAEATYTAAADLVEDLA